MVELKKEISGQCIFTDKIDEFCENLTKSYPDKVQNYTLQLYKDDKAMAVVETNYKENALTILKVYFEVSEDNKHYYSYEMWKEPVERGTIIETAINFMKKQKFGERSLYVGRNGGEILKEYDIHRLPYGTKNINKYMAVCGTSFVNLEKLEDINDHLTSDKFKTMKNILESRKKLKDIMNTLNYKNFSLFNKESLEEIKKFSISDKDYKLFEEFENKILTNVVGDIFGKHSKIAMVGSMANNTAIKGSTLDYTVLTSIEVKKDKKFNKEEAIEKVCEILKKEKTLSNVYIEKSTKFNIIHMKSSNIPDYDITLSADNLLGVEFTQVCESAQKQCHSFALLGRLLRIWLKELSLNSGETKVWGTYFFDLLLLRLLEKRRLITYNSMKSFDAYKTHNYQQLTKKCQNIYKLMNNDKEVDKLMIGSYFMMFLLEYGIHFPQHHGMTFPFSTVLDSHTIDLSHGKLCFVKGGFTVLHSAYIGDIKKYRYFVNALITSLWEVVSFLTNTAFNSVNFKYVKEDGTNGEEDPLNEYLIVHIGEIKENEDNKSSFNFDNAKKIMKKN
uniref:NTP_transf_2 domain-containing protein n=1 Tax=Parastrongyloides trichosuri TaxID=131310 RepID=A0A0N4Z8A0_PARTI